MTCMASECRVGLACRAKVKVPEIANARDNVFALVEVRVDGRRDDFDFRKLFLHQLDALGSSDQIEKDDVFLEHTVICIDMNNILSVARARALSLCATNLSRRRRRERQSLRSPTSGPSTKLYAF
jgi:hypothetical protein